MSEIALIDLDVERAKGDAMDLGHSVPLSSPVRVCAGSYKQCADADIVIVAAGVAQREGGNPSRPPEAQRGGAREHRSQVIEHNPSAIPLIATNPADIMSFVAWKLSGLPSERVIGSGTVLDTARFRYLLGQHLSADPRNIHAYVIGEHGDSEVVLWSRPTVAGIPFADMASCAEASRSGRASAKSRASPNMTTTPRTYGTVAASGSGSLRNLSSVAASYRYPKPLTLAMQAPAPVTTSSMRFRNR